MTEFRGKSTNFDHVNTEKTESLHNGTYDFSFKHNRGISDENNGISDDDSYFITDGRLNRNDRKDNGQIETSGSREDLDLDEREICDQGELSYQ